MRRLPCNLLATSLLVTLLCLSGCSPVYVIRAGWEEAQILLGRTPLEELISAEDTTEENRARFALVLEVRDYARKKGMTPGGSFTSYSDVGRDVLVWVLSASPKTSLQAVTWWFPIVGRVPYKGFFDKEDGLSEARELEEENFDIYLRPSPAFSTLGWFDDPLLSTLLRYSDVTLANIVFHELLHNTVWIPNHVAFNETCANAFGAFASYHFFRDKFGETSEQAVIARDQWHDQLVFSEFLDASIKRLEALYEGFGALPEDKKERDAHEQTVLEAREQLFQELVEEWQTYVPELKTRSYTKIRSSLNNAVILAKRVYSEQLGLFNELYERKEQSLEGFVDEIKLIRDLVEEEGGDPYEHLQRRLAALEAEKERSQIPDAPSETSPKESQDSA